MEKSDGSEVELLQFKESFETFNKIINNLQRQYLSLEKEYGKQGRELETINGRLRATITENRAATAFLNSILSSLTSGVVVVDASGVISHFNPAAERLTGIPTDRALGCKYDRVIAASSGGRYSALDTMMSGVEFDSEEKTIITASGENLPVSVSTTVLRNDAGESYGAVEIFFDITKIKKLEAEVSRVKTLAALGEMAATVAHEVRNPLGGIGGFAALLKRELEGDEEKQRLVDKIILGVDTLNQTVVALLDYTRREQLNLREVSLGRLIEDTVEYEHADSDNGSNVDIRIEIGQRNLRLLCDPHMMRQVLLNLLRNGREAITGHGTITVRGGAADGDGEDDDGKSIWIEVSDTGEGIPDEHKDKIFRPFFTTRTHQKGSGLGLASVWKTVQAHGGDISVSSKAGEGSVFRIELPYCR